MVRNSLISLEQPRDGISARYSPDTMESRFHRAMVAIYDHVLLERRYDANRYLHLLVAHGGVITAKDFLNSAGFGTGFGTGFEGLWQRGPLEKTLEYLVLLTQFSGLFTDAEKNRLQECGYIPDPSK